ncbi:MAG: family 78 glycoside hydrolase catalytic domain [Chloroflexi bacterium]|nr:family 78 glycoside hydrolase catalytic domain [Chloroflexota bacterium]OJW06218.1 MAG: hypothetical protein BGO39_25565 [Chloroflexi bacterium 54-19]
MTASDAASTVKIANLRCEYTKNPLGLEVPDPRLSWIVESEERGQRQTAFQILVASSPQKLAANDADLWDSGKVTSSQTHHHAYAGTPLKSGQTAWWKVRLWDKAGNVSGFSETAWFEMGLLAKSDWTGEWIGTAPGETTVEPTIRLNQVDPVPVTVTLEADPYLRRDFQLAKPVARARIYATAKGVYELHLNGQRVGNDYLAPGWTDYPKRLLYQAYDVTGLLQPEANTLGAVLGLGWFAGHIGWDAMKNYYGTQPQLLAQLVVEYTDGTIEVVGSDSQWRATTKGAIRYSDFLAGELYDARQELVGWASPGYDDSAWTAVNTYGGPTENLLADCAPAIQVTEDVKPIAILPQPDGKTIFDMGQNMVGWVKLRVNSPAGTRLQLRFGEMLDTDGSLYTLNLRSARQTDIYIAKGAGEEIFEPHFTFHGFRYVELSGYEGTPDLELVTGRVIHSDAPRSGTLKTSNELVNQLVSNIRWGQRGNFVSVPTDCPQRDERLGWMGDAQIFARTATYNMDLANFYRKWINDVVDGQSEEGGFSDVAPRMVDLADGAPAWGDAGVIIPWTVYLMYGDTRVIEQNFEAMAAWMRYLHKPNPNFIRANNLVNNFGDWLALDNAETVTDIDQQRNPGEWMAACQATPKELLATAYWAYDATLMAKMAKAIGREAEVARYTELFEQIKAAFIAEFVSEDGHLTSDSQTSYILALQANLIPDHLKEAAAGHLVANIKRRSGHLSTGFVGVGYLCPVLSENGYSDVAYELLLKTTFPSWGYSIEQGATTIWERWDGWTKEKGFQSPTMNSFNHYSLGSVGQWLYQYVAGIDTDPEKPGFYHSIVRPQVDPRLTSVEASYEALTGLISSAWQTEGDKFTLHLTIPANTTATVSIPTTSADNVKEGGQSIAQVPGIEFVKQEGNAATYNIGSGSYVFTSQLA